MIVCVGTDRYCLICFKLKSVDAASRLVDVASWPVVYSQYVLLLAPRLLKQSSLLAQ